MDGPQFLHSYRPLHIIIPTRLWMRLEGLQLPTLAQTPNLSL